MEGRFFKDKLSVLGNVGIGTTSSRGPLEVHAASDSTLIIERFASNGIQLRADNSVNSAIRLGFEAYTYEFKNGSGNSRLHIDANGKVGIGIASPQRSVSVYTASSPVLQLVNSTTGTGSSDGFLLTQGGLNTTIENSEAGYMAFRTSANEKMRIDASGLVGIGTTSPGSYFGSGNTLVIANTASSAGITIVSNTANSGNIYFSDGTSGSDRTRGLVGYNHAANYMVFHTDAAEAMRIDASGNVGIGNTNPQGTLDLGSATGGKSIVWGGTSGTNHYTSIWSEYGTGSLVLAGGLKSSTTDANFIYPYTGTYGYAAIELDSFHDDGIKFYTAADAARTAGAVATKQERMRIDTSGNVGIGTTNTGNHKLKVIGETHSTHFITGEDWTAKTGGLHIGNDGLTTGAVSFYNSVDGGGSGNIYRDSNVLYVGARSGVNTRGLAVDINGNVGIGMDGPLAKLDITGTFRVSDWAQFANTGENEIVLGSSGSNYGFIMNPSAGVWSLGYGSNRDNLGTSVLSWSSSNLVTINNAYNLLIDGGNITLANSAGDNSATISNAGASGSSKINVADALYVIEGGNVGVGTASPDGNLEIWESAVDTAASLRLTGDPDAGANTEYANIIFHSRDSSTGANGGEAQIRAYRGGDRDAPYLNFDLANTGGTLQQVMTIHGQNNAVGIGTTIPNNELVVSDGIQPSYTPAVGGEYIEIARTSGADAGFLINKNTGQWLFGIDNSDGTNPPLRFEYSAAGSAHAGFGNATLGLALKYDGNVGIGTTSPNAKLEIKSDGSAAGGAEIRLTHANNNNTDVISTLNFANNIGSAAMIQGGTTGANNTGYISFFTDNAGTSSEKVRIIGDGNVGIGTTSPTEKLEITGNVRIMPSSGDVKLTLTDAGTRNWDLRVSDGSDYFEINGTTSTSLVIRGAGDVGIGTISPSQKLHVVGKALITDDVQLTGSNPRIDFNTNGSSSLRFYDTTNTAERMRITGAGKVGIGTASPSYKLHVYGSGFAESVLNLQRTDAGTHNDPNIIFSANSSANASVALGGLWYQNAVDNNYNAIIRARTDNNAGTSGRLDFVTGIAVSNSTVPSMVIKGDGNVGIGTISPANTLHVNSGGTNTVARFESTDATARIILQDNSGQTSIQSTGDDMLFTTLSGLTERMRIKSGGNVGIGTDDPDNTLHVNSGGTNTVAKFESTDIDARIRIADDSSYSDIINSNGSLSVTADVGNTVADSYFRVNIDNSEKLRIISDGNVGIGTTSPNYKLHTVGGAGVFDVTGAATLNHHLAVTEVATLPDWRPYAGTTTAALQIQSSATRGILLAAKSTGNQDFYNTDGLDIYVASTIGSSSSDRGILAISAKSDGNVGVGTTSPTSKLQIIGSTSGDSVLKVDGTNGTLFEVVDDLSDSLMSVNDAAGLPVFEVFADNHIVAGRYNQNDFYLNTNGNLGLGTGSPGYKLHVSSPTTSAAIGITGSGGSKDTWSITSSDNSSKGVLNFRDEDSSTTVLTLRQDGFVGIGTASPSNPLDVVGYIKSSIGFKAGNYTTMLESGNESVFGNTAYYGVLFKTNNATRMKITNAGDVGIGTTSNLSTAKLDVRGNIYGQGFNFSKSGSAIGASIYLTNQAGDASSNDLTITAGQSTNSIVLRSAQKIEFYTYASGAYNNRLTIANNGTVNVTGTFTAGTKSFLIDHPTKENHMLQYGSLEGPEFGVYVRGKTDLSEIELPEVWIGLVHEGSITVSFTPRGKFLPLFLNKIENNTIYVGGTEGGVLYDYVIYGTRKDIDDLVTEFAK